MPDLFNPFLKEKRCMNNSSENISEFYKSSFKAFNLTEPITKSQLTERVTFMRADRLKNITFILPLLTLYLTKLKPSLP